MISDITVELQVPLSTLFSSVILHLLCRTFM